jgi:hypothetical protein
LEAIEGEIGAQEAVGIRTGDGSRAGITKGSIYVYIWAGGSGLEENGDANKRTAVALRRVQRKIMDLASDRFVSAAVRPIALIERSR